MPGDYKTGSLYGEWWGKLTNTIFCDGKTLYGYIDEWLTTWRPIFTPDHNNLFTQLQGNLISGSDFRQKIERLFCRFNGVPVNPHSLRHIYITYLKSIHVSDAELESAAAAMAHSRETQSKIYDLMTLQDKLAPSLELTRRIGENFYRSYKVISS
jgi:site-specific recombinase XerC